MVNQAMERLSVLVGNWNIQAIRGETSQNGRASFEWLEDGAFLVHHWDFLPADLPPAGTWIYGSDESSEQYTVLYFDVRGVSRVLRASMVDGVWRLWRDDPHFAQRLTGTLSEDGNTINVNVEKCLDGKNWEHDFELIYTHSS